VAIHNLKRKFDALMGDSKNVITKKKGKVLSINGRKPSHG
jgi:hypothetical protein